MAQAQRQEQGPEPEQEPQKELTLFQTDPAAILNLATCRGPNLTSTTPWDISFSNLIDFLSEAPPVTPDKLGKGFIIGNCQTSRRDANMDHASVCVIDADSSLLIDGSIRNGAPPPFDVHAALVSWNFSHVIYTTYSHGTSKGCRYRIILPVSLDHKAELAGFAHYIVGSLQGTAQIPLALSRESMVWTQLWALPRIPLHSSPYEVYHHLGVVPDPKFLAFSIGLLSDKGVPVTQTIPPLSGKDAPTNGTSTIGLFNRYFPIERHLRDHGYEFFGQTPVITDSGESAVHARYCKPGSASPGVLVFKQGDTERLYSHHTNDPLCNGLSNDSFDVFMLLHGFDPKSKDSMEEALGEVTPLIQDAVSHELNEEHPSIMLEASKFRIGNRFVDDMGSETFGFMDWTSFTMMQANLGGVPYIETKADGKRDVKLMQRAKFWLGSSNRINYKGVVYEPCPILEPPTRNVIRAGQKYFNLFRGWSAIPRKGNWPLWEWHLRNSLSSGEEQYNYWLDWFAHMVQFPTEKPGVAVVLRGGKGWGKSEPIKCISKALGSNAITLANTKQLAGQFNGHLRTKILATLEEVTWPGSHQQDGPLKHLITDQTTSFEAKGRDVIQGVSYLRVVMIANDDWVATATADERRYFIPTLSDASKLLDEAGGRKGGFFPRLFSEMEGGGVEAFLWDMAHREVSRNCVVNVPETDGLKEQRAMSLNSIESWVFSALSSGEIRDGETTFPWTSTGCSVPEEVFRNSISRTMSRFDLERNFEYRVNQGLHDIFRNLHSRIGRVREFGPLDECRKAFVRHTKVPDNVFDHQPSGSALPDNVSVLRRGSF